MKAAKKAHKEARRTGAVDLAKEEMLREDIKRSHGKDASPGMIHETALPANLARRDEEVRSKGVDKVGVDKGVEVPK